MSILDKDLESPQPLDWGDFENVFFYKMSATSKSTQYENKLIIHKDITLIYKVTFMITKDETKNVFHLMISTNHQLFDEIVETPIKLYDNLKTKFDLDCVVSDLITNVDPEFFDFLEKSN